MAEHKFEKLAEWLRHMQQVNHPLRHIPEMAAHIDDLKDWERSVNAIPVLVKALEDIANTFDAGWMSGSIERSIGDRARAALASLKESA